MVPRCCPMREACRDQPQGTEGRVLARALTPTRTLPQMCIMKIRTQVIMARVGFVPEPLGESPGPGGQGLNTSPGPLVESQKSCGQVGPLLPCFPPLLVRSGKPSRSTGMAGSPAQMAEYAGNEDMLPYSQGWPGPLKENILGSLYVTPLSSFPLRGSY